jgi:hypothetical protein
MKVTLELTETQAWTLTEIVSQFVDELGTDSDLVDDGAKLYELIIDARSKKENE